MRRNTMSVIKAMFFPITLNSEVILSLRQIFREKVLSVNYKLKVFVVSHIQENIQEQAMRKIWRWLITVGNTPLNKLYVCATLTYRVRFLSPFGLKMDVDFAHYGLKSGMAFKGTKRAHQRICSF